MNVTGEGKGESLRVCPYFHASVRLKKKNITVCGAGCETGRRGDRGRVKVKLLGADEGHRAAERTPRRPHAHTRSRGTGRSPDLRPSRHPFPYFFMLWRSQQLALAKYNCVSRESSEAARSRDLLPLPLPR